MPAVKPTVRGARGQRRRRLVGWALVSFCLCVSPEWTPTVDLYAEYAPEPIAAALRRRVDDVARIHGVEAGIPSADGRKVIAASGLMPDGDHVVVERSLAWGEQQLYVESTASHQKIIVEERHLRAEHLRISDDGRWVYFRVNDRQADRLTLYRFDWARGVREEVFDEPGYWTIEDLRPDGTLLLAKLTSETSHEIYEYSPTEALRPLLGQGEENEWEARYDGDGQIIARGAHGGDKARLWHWKGGVLTPVTPESTHEVADFRLLLHGTRVVYTTNEQGFTRLHALDLTTLDVIGMPTFPDDVVRLGSVSPGGGRFVTFTVSGARRPQASYLLDGATGEAIPSPGLHPREWNTQNFAKASVDTYPARDGTRIPFVLRIPLRCEHPDGPCPVVVRFHGGPEDQATPDFCPLCELLAEGGYIVVEPNIRGSSGYGRAWLHADDRENRLRVLTDIEDAAAYARGAFSVGGVVPRVGALGASFGGYAALVGMSIFAGAYDAGVSIMGQSDLVTLVRGSSITCVAGVREYGDPDDDGDRDYLRRLSPLTYADRVRAPLMFLHGAEDPRVPVGESVQMRDALARRGFDAPMIIFPHEGHGFNYEDFVLELAYTLAFFDAHLKGPAAPRGDDQTPKALR